MQLPNLAEEKRLWRKGYKCVAGLDEVGRGALCGPVVAAAVFLNPKFKILNPKQIPNSKFQILKLKDSKKLTPKMRKVFYKVLVNHPLIKWGIGRVYPRVIDRINIRGATELAMKRAINKLKSKIQNPNFKTSSKSKIQNFRPDFLILDGKMELKIPIAQKSIVKADEKVLSCAIASILAKVKRDKTMQRYHKKYPQYGINRHKGYGTEYHLKMVKKFGASPIHRQSFRPIKEF